MSWLVPRDDLTLDQLRAVELDPREHRVIVGAPGSGKTLVLLHRARHLCEQNTAGSSRFHIFVFTNVLKQYIKTALTDLGLPEDRVTTFDEWCSSIYRDRICPKLPWDYEKREPDYVTIRKKVAVKLGGRVLFDFVLVDEAQDLTPETFDFIRGLAKHVTVAMDHKQQIYDSGSGEAQIIRALGVKRSDVVLLGAFRCCPYVVRVAAEFIEDTWEREAFLSQTRAVQTGIQTPFLYEAPNVEEEKDYLLEVLRRRQLVDQRLGILLPKNSQVESFAKKCREEKVAIETRKTGLNFANAIPKAMTIHSAKGLTFDSVFLPRLVSSSFARWSERFVERLLYVGITRATRWVYFSTVRGKAIPALEKIRALASLEPPVVTLGSPEVMPHVAPALEQEDGVLDIL